MGYHDFVGFPVDGVRSPWKETLETIGGQVMAECAVYGTSEQIRMVDVNVFDRKTIHLDMQVHLSPEGTERLVKGIRNLLRPPRKRDRRVPETDTGSKG